MTFGDGFFWLTEKIVSRENLPDAMKPDAKKVSYESLRALFSAFSVFGASEEDISDVFYNNAGKLFGIEKPDASLTQDLYKYAKTIIPGGTQLLSKRPRTCAVNGRHIIQRPEAVRSGIWTGSTTMI